MLNIKYRTKEAIQKLTEDLNLFKVGEFSQDWEYEVADETRVKEFLEYYSKEPLNNDEKFTLMLVILESYLRNEMDLV